MSNRHWDCEYTDTFGREANYSWVRRASIPYVEDEPQRNLVRRAKKALGITGTMGRTFDHGDFLEFRPHNLCCVAFIQFSESEEDPA